MKQLHGFWNWSFTSTTRSTIHFIIFHVQTSNILQSVNELNDYFILTLRDYLLSYLNFSFSIISRAVEVRLYFIVLNIISCLHLIPFLFYLNFRERHLIFRACFIFKVSDSRSKIQFTIFKKESNNKVFYVTFNVCSMMFDEKVPNIKNK